MFLADSDAMLFNLTSGRHFPNKGTGKEIFCSSNFGPCFRGSGGGTELIAFSEPFNGDGKCRSDANKPSYDIPVDGYGTNLLTGKKDGCFTISELEVWQVTYIK
jgi:hypothetical protein